MGKSVPQRTGFLTPCNGAVRLGNAILQGKNREASMYDTSISFMRSLCAGEIEEDCPLPLSDSQPTTNARSSDRVVESVDDLLDGRAEDFRSVGRGRRDARGLPPGAARVRPLRARHPGSRRRYGLWQHGLLANRSAGRAARRLGGGDHRRPLVHRDARSQAVRHRRSEKEVLRGARQSAR